MTNQHSLILQQNNNIFFCKLLWPVEQRSFVMDLVRQLVNCRLIYCPALGDTGLTQAWPEVWPLQTHAGRWHGNLYFKIHLFDHNSFPQGANTSIILDQRQLETMELLDIQSTALELKCVLFRSD